MTNSKHDDLNLNLPSEDIKQGLLDGGSKPSEVPGPTLNPSMSKLLSFQEDKPKKTVTPDALEVLAKEGEISDSKCILQFSKYLYSKQQKAIIEESVPDADKFLPLSWDPKATRLGNKVNKHYRYYVSTELEKSLFVDSNTFDEFLITRGTRLEKKNFLGTL